MQGVWQTQSKGDHRFAVVNMFEALEHSQNANFC